MSYIMVDVESDGPIPGDYSMISIGAVLVSETLDTTFYAELRPISDHFIPHMLAVSGFNREQTLSFDDPRQVLLRFRDWIAQVGGSRPIFIADNNGFDFAFVSWYFHHFLGENPFGYSSQNLGSLYKGLVKDTHQNFKYLRQTEHRHNALEDAIGNAEALLYMKREMGLSIRF